MPEFLELIPPTQARAILLGQLSPGPVGIERIESRASLGRVLAEPVTAEESLPAFARSTVDGYAVGASSTYGASDALPAYLALAGEVQMGRQPAFSIKTGQAALIYTGGMLPDGADAVVMLEMTQLVRPGEIEVFKAVAPGENILKAGEDVAVGAEVIPAGVILRPAEIGGLMALGQMAVTVARKPRVGILASGDEVIPPDHSPALGQVRDINSYSMEALVEQEGGSVQHYGILPDLREPFEAALRRSLAECDLVVITAGSSASTRDLTSEMIGKVGRPGVLVHGVNVRPGKPTILAVCDGKPVIGLPGNPVSALVIARIFVIPVLHHLLGLRKKIASAVVTARLMVNIASQAGREDWVPVILEESGGFLQATPIFYKSNLIFSLVNADGLVHIPADATGLETGEIVNVELV